MPSYLPISILDEADAEDFKATASGLIDGFRSKLDQGLSDVKRQAQQVQQAVPIPRVELPSISSLMPWAAPEQAPAAPVEQPEQQPVETMTTVPLPSLSAFTPWEPDVPDQPSGLSQTPEPSATPTFGSDPVERGGDLHAYARQAAVRAGVDPDIFERQIQQESGFNPTAGSPAGAQGIAQIMPQYHPGVDTSDPYASLDYAANLMKSHLSRYGGDYRKALQAYNAGPGAVESGAADSYGETNSYVRNILQGGTGPTARTAPPQEAPAVDQAALDDPDKWALCGPVAAVLAATAHGADWTVAQAKKIASSLGLWNADRGMAGLGSEIELLKQAGVAATTGPADQARLAEEAQNGNTPIVSTDGHYYVLHGYDPATGKFDTGTTGTVYKGGSRWLSLDDMARLSGNIQGAAYMDNPASPTPSLVVASPTVDTSRGENIPNAGLDQPGRADGVNMADDPQANFRAAITSGRSANPFASAFRVGGASEAAEQDTPTVGPVPPAASDSTYGPFDPPGYADAGNPDQPSGLSRTPVQSSTPTFAQSVITNNPPDEPVGIGGAVVQGLGPWADPGEWARGVTELPGRIGRGIQKAGEYLAGDALTPNEVTALGAVTGNPLAPLMGGVYGALQAAKQALDAAGGAPSGVDRDELLARMADALVQAQARGQRPDPGALLSMGLKAMNVVQDTALGFGQGMTEGSGLESSRFGVKNPGISIAGQEVVKSGDIGPAEIFSGLIPHDPGGAAFTVGAAALQKGGSALARKVAPGVADTLGNLRDAAGAMTRGLPGGAPAMNAVDSGNLGSMADNAPRVVQDEFGSHTVYGDAIDPGGNWKRLEAIPDDQNVVLYHATSRDRAESIVRNGYDAQGSAFTNTPADYVYLGNKDHLGTYEGLQGGNDPAFVAFKVPKGALEPDAGTDWKTWARNNRADLRAQGINPVNPTAVNTFAEINQVRAHKSVAEPIGIIDARTGDFTPADQLRGGDAATSGRPGGLLPTGDLASPGQRLAGQAVGGAVAGGYAASQEEGADLGSVAKGALLGAAGGVARGALTNRSTGQLLRGVVDRAGQESDNVPGAKTWAASVEDPNKRYEFHYEVRPLYDLTTSHTDAFTPHPDFPGELQPRLRDRAASRDQINRIAADLAPDALLAETHRLDSGPPIIGPDGVVESGNGRTLALRSAALQHPEKFAEYQAALRAQAAELGIDPAQLDAIPNPVLVRVRETSVDRAKFAAEANQAAVLEMSPFEKASQDAGRISPETLSSLQVSESQSIDQALMAAGNRDVIRGIMATIPANERAGLMTETGELNSAGLQRVKSALFAMSYPGEAGKRLSKTFLESIDSGIKNVENGMFASLPAMGRAEGLIRTGQRAPDLSLSNDLAAAVDVLARLRQDGMPVKTYLAQDAMFERELTPLQEQLLGHLDSLSRAPRRIRDFIQGYADAVESEPHPDQGSLFGDMPKATRGELIDRASGGATDATAAAEQSAQPGLLDLGQPEPRAAATTPEAAPAQAARPRLEEPGQGAVPAEAGGAGVEPPREPPAPPAPEPARERAPRRPARPRPTPVEQVLDLTQTRDSSGAVIETTARAERAVPNPSGAAVPVRETVSGTAVSPAGAAAMGDISPETLARMPNIAKVAPPEVVASLARTAEQNPGLIDRYRRGTITHRELINDLAPRLGMTAEDFLKSKVGTAFNDAELLALRATVVEKTAGLGDLAANIAEKGGVDALSASEKAEAISALVDAARLQAVGRGAAATAGRTLNPQKIAIDRTMAQAIVGGNERISAKKAVDAAQAAVDAAKARMDARATRQAEQELKAAQMRQARADAVAGKAAERQQQQAMKVLQALGGQEVSEDVLKKWVELQQSGDALAAAQFLKGLQKASLWDRIDILRYGSMLSSTSTHLTNALGNTIADLGDVAIKPLTVAADVAQSRITGGPRTRYMAEVGPQVQGLIEGGLAGLKEAAVVLKTGIDPSEAGKLDMIRPGFASGNAAVDLAVELPLRMLTAADLFFRGAARGGHVRAGAVRLAMEEGNGGAKLAGRVQEIVQNITDFPEILNAADKAAARTVLQESRAGSAGLMMLRNNPNLEAGRHFVSLAMPFVKTPYNIAAQGLGMTPAGLYGVVRAAQKGERGEAVDRAARALFGTAVMGTAYGLGAAGFMTGAYPEDAAERSTLPPGWQPWSLKVPNADGKTSTYVSFANLGPVGVPLALGSLSAEGARQGKPPDPAALAFGAGKFMVDQTFMRGLSDVLNALSDPARYAENFSEGVGTQYLPYAALQRQIVRALDMGARDPHGAIEAIMAASPLTAEMVPPRTNALGDPVKPAQTGAAAFVSPLRYDVEKPDATLKAFRDADMGIPAPPKTLSLGDGQSIPLKPQEQRQFQRDQGDLLRRMTEKITTTPGYQKASPENQRVLLESVLSAAREGAVGATMKSIGGEELKNRLRASLGKAG